MVNGFRIKVYMFSQLILCFMCDIQAWIWCIGPLLIYITERLIRAFRSFQRVELIQVRNAGYCTHIHCS